MKPETFDMELFSVSDRTIRAPKTVEDELKTIEEKENAADEVGRAYVFKKEMAQNRVSFIESIFDFVKETNLEAERKVEMQEDDQTDIKIPTLEEKLHSLKTKLTENVSEDITDAISDEMLLRLLQLNSTDLQHLKEIVVLHVESAMNEKIREEDVGTARRNVAAKLEATDIPRHLRSVAVELGQYAIVPNDIYDETLTNERRQQAMEEVEPVRILQGQIIVQEGHLIDRETYRQLELLGLLKSNPSKKPMIGIAIFSLLIIGTIYLYFSRMKGHVEYKQNQLLMTSMILIISLLVMKIVALFESPEIPEVAYIFPAALAPILIKILVNERLSLTITIILAACGSIIFHDGITNTINVEIAVYILFSGLAGILFLSSRNERNHILRVGIFVSCVNLILILFLILIGSGQFSPIEYFYYSLYSVLSGILSAIFAIGLLPYFEAGFGLLSTMKLIELSSPNHPLLKRLLTETPGTYHHSVMVANLAETACDAIGANGLLARVGCYYHDIGKTKRPMFFIENQMNIENPHNQLSPEASRDIIIAHTTDGVAELKKHKLPKEIIDIAAQHHGTSLLKYFYYNAKKQDENTKEEDYRYPGPKPQSKEIAIISLADSVEAAVRSMSNPTRDEIRQLVHQIAQDKLQDGQFNECDLTLKEIEVVKNTFCETLNGIFHSRIEYPDTK